MLKISNLKATIDNKEILKGVDLEVRSGEVHVLMGPNGSGKSTLAQVIAGAPQFKVHPTSLKLRGASSSSIIFYGKDITRLTPDKRAKMGIFLGFQHPVEVPGVSVFGFLRKAKNVGIKNYESRIKGGKKNHNSKFMIPDSNSSHFREELRRYMSELKLPEDFLRRSLNEGFSGGEKKRNEILQMMALKPKLAILDEIDSGLDVDGLKLVASAIKQFAINNRQSSIILITHYARILKYLKPDYVHVMVDGKIIKSGKMSLAKRIEEKGYEKFLIQNSKFKVQND